jgi:fatty aldehyde-generating acyl-ACP reductase
LKFAFIIHPLEAKDAAKIVPVLKYFPDGLIESFMKKRRPQIASHVTGITSLTGQKTEGLFIACPMTPRMMMNKLPLDYVYETIIECTRLAAAEGAEIIGLGAFTAVVGDGGITVEKESPIAVTTGNSYTIATAIEGAMMAAKMVGMVPSESTLAVVGATGSIGQTCAKILAPEFQKTLVVGRDLERTEAIANDIDRGVASIHFDDIQQADLVITVTSSDTAIVEPQHLKQGAVVCDVARPRDVSQRVAKERPDVLLIEGGVVSVPGPVDFGITFGFPPGTAYACMSETMMLALEGRAESYTLGKNVSVEQAQEMQRLADRHGFKLSGFRSFERAVDQEQIDFVREIREKHVLTR